MKKVYRHFDVLINRSQEGLRVVDEICRFHLDIDDFDIRLKEIRHSFKSVIDIDDSFLLNSRDSVNDPGFSHKVKSEIKRDDIYSICKASFKRVIESVRVMEELSKLPEITPLINLESLRQRLYQLEKEVLLKFKKLRLYHFIYPIIDDSFTFDQIALIEKYVGYAQLRLKNYSDREISEKIITLKKDHPNLKIIINDRADLCLIHNLAGVHLGQDDLDPVDVRKIVGDDKILGVSTHDLEQVDEIDPSIVDYIGFGPLFHTNTKDTGYSERGVDFLERISKVSPVPIVAIGGIDRENMKIAKSYGADCVATISALRDSSLEQLEMILKS